MKWENKIQIFYGECDEALEYTLNQMGNLGWKLVNAILVGIEPPCTPGEQPSGNEGLPRTKLFFRREIPEQCIEVMANKAEHVRLIINAGLARGWKHGYTLSGMNYTNHRVGFLCLAENLPSDEELEALSNSFLCPTQEPSNDEAGIASLDWDKPAGPSQPPALPPESQEQLDLPLTPPECRSGCVHHADPNFEDAASKASGGTPSDVGDLGEFEEFREPECPGDR